MSMIKGIACSVGGGMVGAAIWAGAAFATGYEFGILAWVVGGLAGLGMYFGAGSSRTRLTGVAAAAIALVAVLGGKFIAVSLYIDHMIAKEGAAVIDDEVAQQHMRSEIYDQMVVEQVDLTWPDGMDAGDAMEEGYFPVEVTAAAARRWNAMDEVDREQFKTNLQAATDADLRHAQGVLTGLAFIFSFGLLDLLFVGLAVSSAYKFGAVAPGSPDRDAVGGPVVTSDPATEFAAPSAGPLSRIPGGVGDPESPRANEPPLIIKRKDAA